MLLPVQTVHHSVREEGAAAHSRGGVMRDAGRPDQVSSVTNLTTRSAWKLTFKPVI